MTATAERVTTLTVEEAQRLIAPHVLDTPLTLYDVVGHHNELWTKDEGTQRTGSFKLRGALVLASVLKSEGHDKVVTASAGNHAAGVAASARILDMRAKIYVPESTPEAKRANIRRIGGSAVELVVAGQDFDESAEMAYAESERHDLPYLPPFDHPLVAAGQGTVAREVLEALPHADRLFVPVGGGGLLAGTLQAVEEMGLDTNVVGVQFSRNQSLEKSLKAGELVTIDSPDSLCEGASVRTTGQHSLERALRHSDRLEFITVDTADIGRELLHQDIYRQALAPALGSLAFENFPETTGVLASAGARKYASEYPQVGGEQWVSLVSGSNADPGREAIAMAAWKISPVRF